MNKGLIHDSAVFLGNFKLFAQSLTAAVQDGDKLRSGTTHGLHSQRNLLRAVGHGLKFIGNLKNRFRWILDRLYVNAHLQKRAAGLLATRSSRCHRFFQTDQRHAHGLVGDPSHLAHSVEAHNVGGGHTKLLGCLVDLLGHVPELLGHFQKSARRYDRKRPYRANSDSDRTQCGRSPLSPRSQTAHR